MRLTEKDIAYITSGANVIEIPDIVEGHKYTGQAIIKLGRLEDIEEELGIDLITLFKALKDGIVYKTGYGWETGDYHWNYVDAKYISLGMSYYEPFLLIKLEQEPQCDTLRPEDYGKTWALTKEELL